MNSKSISAAVFLLVLLVVGGMWYWQGRDARQVDAVQREFSKILSETKGEDTPNGKSFVVESPELAQRLAKVAEFSETQSLELAGDFMSKAMGSMAERYQRILDMPRAERNKELDRAIDAQRNGNSKMEKLAEKAEAMDSDVKRVVQEDGDGKRVGLFVKSGGEGEGEGERFLSDNTTPAVRATFDAYKEALRERMRERGINPADVPMTISFSIDASTIK